MTDRTRSAILILAVVIVTVAALLTDPVPPNSYIGRDGCVWEEVRR